MLISFLSSGLNDLELWIRLSPERFILEQQGSLMTGD